MPRRETWDHRIRRANQLGEAGGAPAGLLAFYAQVLHSQKDVYDALAAGKGRPSGSLERDLDVVRAPASRFLHAAAAWGSQPLAELARELLGQGDTAVGDLLLACWQTPSDTEFFAKAILQPYAQWLAETNVAPLDRSLPRTDNRCPFCGGRPQLSILESATGASLDGGGRRLLCATCLGRWGLRRVLCVYCSEEDERKLGYYQASEFDHVRVDACDTCRHYLKTVDLTRLGLAVPLVDEVAAAALDAWARDRGYQKIELNLVGV